MTTEQQMKIRDGYTKRYHLKKFNREKATHYAIYLENAIVYDMVANDAESAKKYGICQNITNRRLIILSAVIGTIVGSFSTAIAFACW